MTSPAIPELDAALPPLASIGSAEEKGGALGAMVAVFVLFIAMQIPWMGFTPLAGTEGHRVFPAHEMVRSGSWLVPMLYGHPFLTKPPLHDWLIAACEVVSGRGNVLIWRLPSLLAGAGLCSLCAFFATRWFGRTAGWISGLAAAGMIAVWGQAQVADIDATNTFASVLTAFLTIDLLIAQESPGLLALIISGLAFAAALLIKGPGCLPIVVAVWVWAIYSRLRPSPNSLPRASSRLLWWRALLMPIVIGVIVFAVYALFAARWLRAHGLEIDKRGVTEGTGYVRHWTPMLLVKSFYTMPPSLFAFSLPLSLALPLWAMREIRANLSSRQRRLTSSLCACVLIGWVVCVISTLENPRYGYVTLPPLCPLAGAVAVAMARSERLREGLRTLTVICAVLFAGAAIALSIASWPLPIVKPLLAGSAVLSVVTAVWIVQRVRVSWRIGPAFALLLLLMAFPFASQRHLSRWKASGIQKAAMLRRTVGEGATIACGDIVTSEPEIFYYARSRVDYFPNRFLPPDVKPGRWVILGQREHMRWLRQPGLRLEGDHKFCRNGETDYFIAWYGGIDYSAR